MDSIRLLSGTELAASILDEVRSEVAKGRAEGRPPPTLASLYRDLPTTPFRFYARQQEKAAAQVGIGFRGLPVPPDLTAVELRGRIKDLDNDRDIHGVIVEHPLPESLDFDGALSGLRPEKDTDGVGETNLGRLITGRSVQVPAVATAALAILRHHEIPVSGRRVGVVGRSPTVGLPIAILLATKGQSGDATVTIVHSKTDDMARALSDCEIIVSCVGRPGLITRANVPKDAIVVDVGLTSVRDLARPSGTRAAGDADATSLEGWASALTPVPGGVGPVTVAQLMANVVKGWKLLTAEMVQ